MLQHLPFSVIPESRQLFVIQIPVEAALGDDDRDFSNINSFMVDMDGNKVGEPAVAVFATGTLGRLSGGRFHVSDVRRVATQEDLAALAIAGVEADVKRKRTGFLLVRTVLFTRGRTELESRQDKESLKRQCSDESLTDAQDAHDRAKEKERYCAQRLESFTRLLTLVTSADRPEKGEGTSWASYFHSLGVLDLEDAPSTLCVSSMPYVDMILQLSQHVSRLSNIKEKATSHANYTGKVLERMKVVRSKTEARLKRKVDQVFTASGDDVVNRQKPSGRTESIVFHVSGSVRCHGFCPFWHWFLGSGEGSNTTPSERTL